jgi:hypothetical protein
MNQEKHSREGGIALEVLDLWAMEKWVESDSLIPSKTPRLCWALQKKVSVAVGFSSGN